MIRDGVELYGKGRIWAVFVVLWAALCALPANAGERVRIENASHLTGCAEEDNVYVKFVGSFIRRLTIEADHPAYLAAVHEDSTAPDFSRCDMSHDPVFSFQPKTVILFENANYRLVGHTLPTFWRPGNVDFRVGGVSTRELHLVQLVRKLDGRDIEILVIYPADGYWRIKPLPPEALPDTAYGSSFLVGPIEEDRRPFVMLSSIEFVPESLSFRLKFRHGAGEVRVAEASRERTRLDISLTPSSHTEMFAALRSMFVSPLMADTAEVALGPDDGRKDLPIMRFTEARAATATFKRSVPSRHNTSAPDLRFGEFAR